MKKAKEGGKCEEKRRKQVKSGRFRAISSKTPGISLERFAQELEIRQQNLRKEFKGRFRLEMHLFRAKCGR